jgi:hypothetical protein
MESRTRAPFRCPASAVVRDERAFGQLTIHANAVAFEPRGFLNSVMAVGVVGRIVHTARDLVLVRARLRPARSNVALLINGDPQLGYGVEASVRLAGRNREAVTSALEAAEYTIDEQVSWFSLTGPSSEGSLA